MGRGGEGKVRGGIEPQGVERFLLGRLPLRHDPICLLSFVLSFLRPIGRES